MTHALLVGALLATLADPPSAKPVDADPPTVRLVYIGSSTCGPCRKPEVERAIAAARDAARAWAARHGHAFAFTGVATDAEVDRGWEFLAENGPFDEVLIGRQWLNLGIRLFVSPYPEEPLATLGIPQVVLLVEEYRFDGSKIREARAPKVVLRSLGTIIPIQLTPATIEAALSGSGPGVRSEGQVLGPDPRT